MATDILMIQMKRLNAIYNFPSLSEKEISNIQFELEVTFPEKYIEFIHQNNGGRFVETVYRTSNENLIISDFLPLEDKQNKTVKDYLELVNNEQQKINWLPFGFDPGGWIFCISLQRENYEEIHIFRMDKIYEEAFDFVSKDFQEFIDHLEPEAL